MGYIIYIIIIVYLYLSNRQQYYKKYCFNSVEGYHLKKIKIDNIMLSLIFKTTVKFI